MYLGESKVLQYFDNVRHNSTALDAFAKFVKVICHTGQWDAKFAWNFPSATHLICLYAFDHGLRSHDFKPTWLGLIVKVLSTRTKFCEPSGYCTEINCVFTFCAKNIFGLFCFWHDCKLKPDLENNIKVKREFHDR